MNNPVSLRTAALTTGVLAILGACTLIEWPPASGRAVYNQNCVMCHGTGGQGDGPLASELFSPPTDLTRLSLNNGGEFPRVAVLSHIDGYVRGENSSDAMPEFGPLLVGDNVLLETGEGVVTPTPKLLLAVANYLESLQITE